MISSFQTVDKVYVEAHLNDEEQIEFYKLLKSEQFHSLRVSKDLVSTYSNSSLDLNELARLGLLHDLGKQGLKYGPFSKSMFVVLKKISKGNLNKYSKFRKTILYYNHPIAGVNILESMTTREYSQNFIEAVRSHHSKGDVISTSDNLYLIALNKCDDRN